MVLGVVHLLRNHLWGGNHLWVAVLVGREEMKKQPHSHRSCNRRPHLRHQKPRHRCCLDHDGPNKIQKILEGSTQKLHKLRVQTKAGGDLALSISFRPILQRLNRQCKIPSCLCFYTEFM